MNIELFDNYVLVKKDEPADIKRVGHLILPSGRKYELQSATVVLTGPGRTSPTGQYDRPMRVKPGDRVLYHSGELRGEDDVLIAVDGVDLLLLSDGEIIARFTE